MFLKLTCKAIIIFCVMTTICASPVSEIKEKADSPFSYNFGTAEERFSPEIVKHRERRQISTFGLNNGLFQTLGKTVYNTVDRIRDAVSSSALPDSFLVRMVNGLSTAFVRSVATDLWNQIQTRARMTVNEFFDTIGVS